MGDEEEAGNGRAAFSIADRPIDWGLTPKPTVAGTSMKPAERENLIAVKTQLAQKYRRKALNAGSKAKRTQSEMKARSYERQVEALHRAAGA
jgi:hypothetical protein